MEHCLHPANLQQPPRQAHRVVELAFANRRLHRSKRLATQNLIAGCAAAVAKMKASVTHKVHHRRCDSTRRPARSRQRPRRQRMALLIDRRVAGGEPMVHHVAREDERAAQAERIDHQLLERRFESLAGDLRDHMAGEHKGRVIVRPLRAERRELRQFRHRGDVAPERIVAVARVEKIRRLPTRRYASSDGAS